mmetsp:Transcript_39337/g.84839  ORF Transcript_39337/g.84839 Transcript_39337/m.84839 type:complete len:417 (+) Transcript_39337:678-1928(+)
MIRPPSEHQTGAHDEQLKRPAHDAHVFSPGPVERYQIIHESRQRVDNDSRCGEPHNAVAEAWTTEAGLELLHELIVAHVNVELVVELGHDGLGALVGTKGGVVIVVIEEGVVVVSLLIVTVIVGRGGCGGADARGCLHWRVGIESRRGHHGIGIGIGRHGRCTGRVKGMVGLGVNWRERRLLECFAGLLLIVVHWVVSGGRRGSAYDGNLHICVDIIDASKGDFHRLVRWRWGGCSLPGLVSIALDIVLLVGPAQPANELKMFGKLNDQISLDDPRRVTGRRRWRIIKLQGRPHKSNGRNNTEQTKVRYDVLLGVDQHCPEDEGASDPELIAVERHARGHGAFVLRKPRCGEEGGRALVKGLAESDEEESQVEAPRLVGLLLLQHFFGRLHGGIHENTPQAARFDNGSDHEQHGPE